MPPPPRSVSQADTRIRYENENISTEGDIPEQSRIKHGLVPGTTVQASITRYFTLFHVAPSHELYTKMSRDLAYLVALAGSAPVCYVGHEQGAHEFQVSSLDASPGEKEKKHYANVWYSNMIPRGHTG